jgi:hypothetical protein
MTALHADIRHPELAREASPSKRAFWAGHVVSGLPALLLLFSGGILRT